MPEKSRKHYGPDRQAAGPVSLPPGDNKKENLS